jgi:hypothetical protein
MFSIVQGNTTSELFELLERLQNSRLDDQRCVLPPYFKQVNFSLLLILEILDPLLVFLVALHNMFSLID